MSRWSRRAGDGTTHNKANRQRSQERGAATRGNVFEGNGNSSVESFKSMDNLVVPQSVVSSQEGQRTMWANSGNFVGATSVGTGLPTPSQPDNNSFEIICSLLSRPFSFHIATNALPTKSGVRFSMNATGRIIVQFMPEELAAATCRMCLKLRGGEAARWRRPMVARPA